MGDIKKVMVYDGNHDLIYDVLVSNTDDIKPIKKKLLEKFPGSEIKIKKIQLNKLSLKEKEALQADYKLEDML